MRKTVLLLACVVVWLTAERSTATVSLFRAEPDLPALDLDLHPG